MEVWQTCLLVPELSRSECASWVQAWGTVGALLVAVWVGNRQARQAAEAAKQAIQHSEKLLVLQRVDRFVEKFAAPMAVASAFLYFAKFCRDQLGEEAMRWEADYACSVHRPPHEYLPNDEISELQLAAAAFREVEAHAMPTVASVRVMTELRKIVGATDAAIDRLTSVLIQEPSSLRTAQRELTDSIRRAEYLLEQLNSDFASISKQAG